MFVKHIRQNSTQRWHFGAYTHNSDWWWWLVQIYVLAWHTDRMTHTISLNMHILFGAHLKRYESIHPCIAYGIYRNEQLSPSSSSSSHNAKFTHAREFIFKNIILLLKCHGSIDEQRDDFSYTQRWIEEAELFQLLQSFLLSGTLCVLDGE